jgi:signal transduction histidine kinase
MSGLRLRRLPALALGTCAAMAVASLVFLVLGPGVPVKDDVFGGLGGASFVVLSLAYATVGALVASRVPDNRIGWTFCLSGVAIGLVPLAWAYADFALHAPGGPLPGATAAAMLPGEPAAGLFGLTLLLFPDGRPPARRWRPVAWLLGVGMALLFVTDLFRPGPLDEPFATVTNPIGIPGARAAIDALNNAAWILVVVGIALAAAAMRYRLRRARGVERQRLELVLAAGAVTALAAAVIMATWLIWPHGHLQVRMALLGLTFAAGFPVAAGVAILRHHLYGIDVAVNRTLVYGGLTLLLAAAYAITTLALGVIVGRGSAWTTAGATLAVAVAFRPLRTRVQDAVDRRFNRARYDARRRIAAFLEDLRAGRAAPEAIEGLLRELAGDPRLELRFFLPESQLYVDAHGEPAGAAPADRVCTAIERAGAPVAMMVHASEDRELAALVEAGGLAIEIARLRVELRRQLAEVEASRARIVLAGYEERRRIERDLHDGAQQRLVTIGLALRHAQHELAAADVPEAGRTLDGAVADLAAAIDELRELARGLPPAQLDAGLAPALGELAGRAPLPVELDVTSQRLGRGTEAAAYFVACEGLTNAVKHARATKVAVSAQRCNGALVVRVADDGIGGAHAAGGSGLSGLADRIAAQGGTFAIESEAGRGTTLTAELPCAS